MLPENYYEVLGLKKFADINEVQTAYRKTVKFVHPDVSGDLSKEVLDTGIYHTITEAYDVLSDPEKKKKYDLSIRRTFLKKMFFRPGLFMAGILVYWYVKSPTAIPSRFPLHYTDGVFRVPTAAEWSSWLLTTQGSVFWHFLWTQHKLLVISYLFAAIFVGAVSLVYLFHGLKTAKKAAVIVAARLPEVNPFKWTRNRQMALPEARRSIIERIMRASGHNVVKK